MCIPEYILLSGTGQHGSTKRKLKTLRVVELNQIVFRTKTQWLIWEKQCVDPCFLRTTKYGPMEHGFIYHYKPSIF